MSNDMYNTIIYKLYIKKNIDYNKLFNLYGLPVHSVLLPITAYSFKVKHPREKHFFYNIKDRFNIFQ